MGALLSIPSSILTSCCVQASCCFTSATCGCFNRFTQSSSLVMTRCMYTLHFILASGLAIWLSSSTFESWFGKWAFWNASGYPKEYRIHHVFFTLTLFHGILAGGSVLFPFRWVRSFQKGYWGSKGVLMVGLWSLAVFVFPDSLFMFYSRFIALPCSMVYMLIQMVLFIDFTYRYAETLVTWYHEHEASVSWMYWLVISTVGLLSLNFIGWMYLYFKKEAPIHSLVSTTTQVGTPILWIHALYSAMVSGVPFLPSVQASRQLLDLPNFGLVPTSWILVYATSHLFSASFPTTTSHWIHTSWTLLSITYAAYSMATSTPTPSSVLETGEVSKTEEDPFETDTDLAVSSSSSLGFFHGVLALAACHLSMVFTQWTLLGTREDLIRQAPLSLMVGIKIAAGWSTLTLYLWTLLAPVFFPDREWGSIRMD